MAKDWGRTGMPDSGLPEPDFGARDDGDRADAPFGSPVRSSAAAHAPECGLDPLACELAFERAVFQHRQLSVFRRNATTWEALLMIAEAAEGEGPGLYELVDSVETNALGQSALLRFLRDRRDEGIVLFERSPRKQSKWTLKISGPLLADLRALLQLRAGEKR